MVCLFKKTADVSVVDGLKPSPGHRRLRFSFQINDFKDLSRSNRPHRLTPVVGGGGDLVASVFRVKWFFLKKNLFSSEPLRRATEAGS